MSSRVFSLAKYPHKQDYTERNSEVDMYNMYDDIEKVPKLEEIMQMDIEKGRALIEAVKEKHNYFRQTFSLWRYVTGGQKI